MDRDSRFKKKSESCLFKNLTISAHWPHYIPPLETTLTGRCINRKWLNWDREYDIFQKVTKMGSIIGQKIDYNGVEALRVQPHIPSKHWPKYTLRRGKIRPVRFGSKNQFPLNFAMNISLSKSDWNHMSFWKYFKIKCFGRKITSAPGGHILAVTKSKNSACCRVHHFQVLHFQRFFSLPRIKLVVKWCKAHNFGPSKVTCVY